MTKFPIPDAALTQHTAVLGKTGSGKTTTAKGIVEHLVGQGARVCILDPIKSDWWGLTSSADGKRAGLPFHILGGPRGHVPLHASSGKAIAEIVANGTLPLSIIDMADFAPGGQARFFIEFAPTLLRKMRGVVHLVMEEAHLFAPKERSGVGDENMAIHWAKMLATAGRSKGVRLILVTQRTQALHNAMLGSCETMIAHRLTAPADQKPLIDWLKANTAKDIVEKVSGSLASLKTGTAWVCSGEAKFFELVQFPRIATYDNSATPTGDTGIADVRTAPVDVERLRAIVGDAAKEAEANDPKALKAEIARLKAEAARKPISAQLDTSQAGLVSETTALRDRERAFAAGVKQGREEVFPEAWLAGERSGFTRGVVSAHNEMKAALSNVATVAYVPSQPPKRAPAGSTVTMPAETRSTGLPKAPSQVNRLPERGANTDVSQRLLDALAELEAMQVRNPTREIAAFLTGYSNVKSSPFVAAVGGLKESGDIEFPVAGTIGLTDQGRSRAVAPPPRSADQVQSRIIAMLGGATGRILEKLVAIHPQSISREGLAAHAGYSNVKSSPFVDGVGKLRSLSFVEFPSAGQVRASDVLFLEGV